MQLIKAGQAEQIITCIGDGIAKGIARAHSGYWNRHAANTDKQYAPSSFWHWQGAVVKVGHQPLLRRIGPGYLVRENTGEVFHDEEEKGSCVDPLYSANPAPSVYRGRE